uniref:NADH dehydrogenase subunit 2 n=1 Tax=Atractomorpha echinata TaxID=52677 RepID=A0A076YFE5_9CHLO|nr:NADH dehydrogenase subunit 2 [Atractomorpha echinata]
MTSLFIFWAPDLFLMCSLCLLRVYGIFIGSFRPLAALVLRTPLQKISAGRALRRTNRGPARDAHTGPGDRMGSGSGSLGSLRPWFFLNPVNLAQSHEPSAHGGPTPEIPIGPAGPFSQLHMNSLFVRWCLCAAYLCMPLAPSGPIGVPGRSLHGRSDRFAHALGLLRPLGRRSAEVPTAPAGFRGPAGDGPWRDPNSGPLYVVHWSGLFQNDFFGSIVSFILFLYAAGCFISIRGWQWSGGLWPRSGPTGHGRAPAKIVNEEALWLCCLALYGQRLLCISTDLMSMYVCLELQSFCFIVLCSLNYGSLYSVEAGRKLFLRSAFSSCLMLLGICFIYFSTGQTNCAHIRELRTVGQMADPNGSRAVYAPESDRLQGPPGQWANIPRDPVAPLYDGRTGGPDMLLWMGIWLVSRSLLWKLAVAPLHMWAADVYEGAQSHVTLLLSTLPKISVYGFWLHTWHSVCVYTWNYARCIFSGISLRVGAFGAFTQPRLKRMLAYSSIAHMGFLCMPLCSTVQGYSAGMIHLLLYLFTSLLIWSLIFTRFWRAAHGPAQMHMPQFIWDLCVNWKTMPAYSFLWAVAMMSLAGLPPVAGFLGKYALFSWSLYHGLYALIGIALLSTLISSVYYIRIIRVLYLDVPQSWSHMMPRNNTSATLVTIIMCALLILLWYSSPLSVYTHLLSL